MSGVFERRESMSDCCQGPFRGSDLGNLVSFCIEEHITDCFSDGTDRATRTFGSIMGLYLNYGWAWWFWTEAHEYFVSPFALFLWVGGFVCDIVFAFVLWRVQGTERVLEDGRKEAGSASTGLQAKKMS